VIIIRVELLQLDLVYVYTSGIKTYKMYSFRTIKCAMSVASIVQCLLLSSSSFVPFYFINYSVNHFELNV